MRKLISFFVLTFIVSIAIFAKDESKRPAIKHLSHVCFATKDLENTRQFFCDFLGYEIMTTLKNNDGSVKMYVIKINDNQFVEIRTEKQVDEPRMVHYAFETDDVEAMRIYLKSQNIDVPDKLNYNTLGITNFFVTDPFNRQLEFVQYDPNKIVAQSIGKFMSDTRMSTYMSHVSLATPDLDINNAFFVDILDFKEVWRGGPKEGVIQYLYQKMPEGNNDIELILYDALPTPERLTTMHHICLEVDDCKAAIKILKDRNLPEGCRLVDKINIGTNNIRQFSLFNIDGIRIEVMENHTIDGGPPTQQEGIPLKYIPNK